MWRRKMAARFSEEDGNLNTGKGGFLLNNTSNELVLNTSHEDGVDLNRDSCVDHSILAIFEDSSVPSESKIHAEDDSERLLSALTEMLDRVEEDEDGAFSPFDIVPNTKFLSQTLSRDNATPQELSPSRKLRPRPKPPNDSHQTKTGGVKHQESKVEGSDLPKTLEAKVEVFTSTSLISLVHLMHPYCLKLQVEKEDKLRRNQSLFSQEEVWRYERPTEEGDEEINVVSEDEETPVKRTKVEDELDKKTDKSRWLKSVLLNGNSPRAASSRERKRVSFGPVHVASFDESEEEGFSEKSETKSVSLIGTKTPENPEGSTLEIPSLIFERNTFDDQQEGEKKSEMKAKSLSLQEYRKLRQNRRPLVEKKGNNTTKWPCITEPPKELTPIFCFQEQKQNVPHPDLHKPDHKTSVHCACLPIPSEDKPRPHQHYSRSKSPRTLSKMISPASPLADSATRLEAKKSPVKKTTLLNTDPPNPVLLPLPVPQTLSPSIASSSSESRVETVSLQSSRRLQEIQNESSAAALQTQAVLSEPKPHLLSLDKDLKLNNTTLSQGIKASSTTIPPDGSSASPVQTGCKISSDCSLSETKGEEQLPKSPVKPTKCPPPPLSQPPPLTETPIVLKEEVPHVVQTSGPSEEPPPAPTNHREPGAAVESGIEAPDLTSLLEQFEETQAIEDKVVQMETKLHPGTSPSSVQTDGHVDLNKPEAEGPERTSRLQLKPVKPLEALSPSANLLALQTLEPVDIPEPLCTEIVLSSQQDQPARRKNPPKSIQIIDPRPLPPKKTHTSPAESPPPLVFSYLSFDHDYCRLINLPSDSQSIRTKSSSLTETSKVSTEPPTETQDSEPAEGGQKHTSDEQTSEQLWTSSEALQFSGRAVMEDADVSNMQTPPSILPTPPPSPPERGRDKRRYRRRSPRSDSSSRSSSSSSSSSSCASCSPKRPRIYHSRSESSSCSSSPSSCVSHSPPRRYHLSYSRSSYSRSRSRSWSRSPSRSRSPSPPTRRRWREVRSSRESRKLQREHEVRIQKLKAIDERRVVYVGRIRRTMTHNELRERFSQFGEVECVSLHFRDRGDHYGFVTFYNMEDAFAAIDNGGKLRKPDELPFDICFGGRRQFCNSNYADLDANREAERSPTNSRFEDLDFDSLLKQAQRGQKR